MRRHGWAFCLGLFLTGATAAQPPADEERFPPAPDLPGEVVGQLPPTIVVPKIGSKDTKPVPPAPLPDNMPAPYGGGTVTATVTPLEPTPGAVPAAMGMFQQAAQCPVPACRPSCGIGLGDIKEWLCFRSKARQSGCYPTPYHPPLQAWFPCDPKNGPCGVGGLSKAPFCASCAMGAMPPGAGVPVPPTGDPIPAVPASPEPPLAGGLSVGKCADADVLTTFLPVTPGLGFAPGNAPMANPTSQIKASSWKPR